MPKISVIMPAYNAEKYIAQAIESILGQTYGDFEFIIINDCSKDRTEEIILSYDDPRIIYLKNEQNLGVAKTLNLGLEIAKSEYIARMDADDISIPERFEMQIAHMDKNRQCGVCGSNTMLFGDAFESRQFVFPAKNQEILGDIVFNSPFAHPSVMIRAELIKKYQLRYNSEFEGVEDYYLWHRLLQVSEGSNIQKPLLNYRMHAEQVTQKHKEKQFGKLLQLRRAMLNDYNLAYLEEELDVFARVCFGERKLTEAQYMRFISLGKKLVAHAKEGKKRLAWNYAVLNSAVLKESQIECGRFISWADPVYRAMNFVYKIRRAIK